jgi:very-short-patch-repair endonuclease
MRTDLQNLARYYGDVLTALAENSGRVLRDLSLGRGYGLVADLSGLNVGTHELLTSPVIHFEKVIPDLASSEEDFDPEPDGYASLTQPESDEPTVNRSQTEGNALVRIWRKQKQDSYNRETLLGFGLLRGIPSPKQKAFGPLICFRVKPEYDPETRRFSIEKISGTPFPNITLLGQILSEDELSDLRPKLHELISADEFDENYFDRLAKTMSGSTLSFSGLKYASGRLHSLGELLRLPSASLPILATGAVLFNIPRGNAYLLDDLDALATSGKDDDLKRCALGPILENPLDKDSDQIHSDSAVQTPEPLFPLESNKEQRKVAEHAKHSRVLVVHGPPGTGKSQTICNLVSHLVAEGNTVLVTSQKDKALEVVRDKLPSIDYFAMAMLRSDEDSQKTLLQALEYSRAAAGREDGDKLQKDKRFIEERLAENRRQSDSLRITFSKLKRLEHEQFTTFQSLGRLRLGSSIPSRQKKTWFEKIGVAVESYRLNLTAKRVNLRHQDDTREISNRLRILSIEHRDLVVKLLTVQRRLQLHKAAHNKATSFVVELTKKLLGKKRKTASLEKLKGKINFKDLLGVFPCWILSIDDVARLFPLECGLFDYLIVDEASQCNQATALHLAYRAKRMVVVGDEKQLPNATVQWLRVQTVEQLLQKNGLAEHPKKEFLSAHESLLGLALGSKDRQVYLIEHFRCDPLIIAWSNHEFYGDSLKIMTPLRSMRFNIPIEIRVVNDATEDIERHVNDREASVVISEVLKILDDPKMAGLSLGVISPFQPQADLIFERLQHRLADRWAECERRGLTASTADGFQGDERDIIIYSLRQGPGSRPGSITGIEANQGPRRINVAFTRARRKIILVTSVKPATFPGRYIRSFLDHAVDVSTSQIGPFESLRSEDKFHSEFERDVCTRLRSRNLEVATQFPVAGYFIDMVIRDKAGRRLGIECDGQFHYDELGQIREEDFERQEILERAGWPIHRIPARRYFLDPDRELRLVATVLASQPTDEDMIQLEHEDLGSQPTSTEFDTAVEPRPIQVSKPQSITSRSLSSKQTTPRVPVTPRVSQPPQPPPFLSHEPWIEASRWARVVGQWTLANRVFLWEFGDKLRNGKEPTDADKTRAAALWSDAQRQGFTPKVSNATLKN